MSIIITSNGKDAVKLDKSSFEKEDFLQEYIYNNPESIPLYDIKEDIRLLILAREFPTNSGPIDAIGIDERGELYIVETKLFKNPDKRTVIAQALDYGAALWNHSSNFDEFLSSIDKHTQKVFGLSASAKTKEFFGLSDEEVDEVLGSVKSNLNDGSFHFVVLMDKLDARLKDLIIYVNQNSQFDIYAVELEYYKYKEQEIIIPRIFGAEVKKDIGVTSSGDRQIIQWTEESLLVDAKNKLSKENYSAFEKLYFFSKENADSIKLGTGATRGSFGPVYEHVCPRTIFTLRTDGTLSFNLPWIIGSDVADEFRKNYFEKMKELGFELESDNTEKYTRFKAEEWAPKVDGIINAIEEIV